MLAQKLSQQPMTDKIIDENGVFYILSAWDESSDGQQNTVTLQQQKMYPK